MQTATMAASALRPDDGAKQLLPPRRQRYSVVDLMDKLLEDIYKVAGCDSLASESSTDQTNWSDSGAGGPTTSPTPGPWSNRLTRKSIPSLRSVMDALWRGTLRPTPCTRRPSLTCLSVFVTRVRQHVVVV